MWADDGGSAQCCRLNQVLTAQGHKAAADNGQVAQRVIGGHFAHRIAHPDLDIVESPAERSAARNLKARRADLSKNVVKTLWMARDNHQ